MITAPELEIAVLVLGMAILLSKRLSRRLINGPWHSWQLPVSLWFSPQAFSWFQVRRLVK